VALTVWAGSSCATEEPVEVPRPVWYGAESTSPDLTETGFALKLRLQRGQSPGGPTVALLGAIRAGLPYAERYGGRLASAIQIVAIDSATGQVFHGLPERPGTAPLVPLSDRELAASLRGDAIVEETETHFNVDLIAQLALPRTPASYRVFLWLDDRHSSVAPLTLTEGQGIGGAQPPTATEDAHLRIREGEPADTDPMSPNEVRLRHAPGRRVEGALQLDPASAEEPRWLTVLSLCQRTRRLRLASAVVPPQARSTGRLAFDFDPDRLAGCDRADERTFFLAATGASLSEVLVVEREK
jgi:hypothetical protein